MKAKQIAAALVLWVLFYGTAFAFLQLLPDTTWQSALIVSGPLLPLAFFLVWSFLGGQFRFSEQAVKTTTALSALFGLGYAIYLSISWYSGSAAQCSTGGCATAQASDYADMFFGIATSTVGIIGYVAVLLSLLLRGDWGRMATASLTTIGFGVSMFLTGASVFELETTCQWCLGSAATMTTLFALSLYRLVRSTA